MMKMHKDIFEIIFLARGGQGAKSAAEILAQAAVSEGKFVQAFPNFGPERSGAPTKTYLKISDSEIRSHEPIIDPDLIVVLDETLLIGDDITKNLDKDEALIVNSAKSKGELASKLAYFKGTIYPIDANGISAKIIGQPRPNTAILGKIIHITEAVKLESLTSEFRKVFESKIGKEATDKNILAIEKSYDSV
jgi:pyruvate ferredoxin oxidoreductase gamma subunit